MFDRIPSKLPNANEQKKKIHIYLLILVIADLPRIWVPKM
jgi:hypothetical protein